MFQESLTSQLYHSVVRALKAQRKKIQVVGLADATALAALLSSTENSLSEYVHVVIVANEEIADSFLGDLKFFNPRQIGRALRGFDVSPYSGLYPNSKLMALRTSFLYAAQNSLGGEIFVAPIASLVQKTLPRAIFTKNSLVIKPGFVVPKNFNELLISWGYYPASLVEDLGSFALRGGIVDIFSPAQDHPIRLELFGDIVESIRNFDPSSQRSTETISIAHVIPAREVIYSEDSISLAANNFRSSCQLRQIPRPSYDTVLKNLIRGQNFNGLDFLLPYFYSALENCLAFFPKNSVVWLLDPLAINKEYDQFISQIKSAQEIAHNEVIAPEAESLFEFAGIEKLLADFVTVSCSHIDIESLSSTSEDSSKIKYSAQIFLPPTKRTVDKDFGRTLELLISDWRAREYKVFLASGAQFKIKRLQSFLTESSLHLVTVNPDDAAWPHWLLEQQENQNTVHLIPRAISESYHFPAEKVLILSDSIFAKTKKLRSTEKEFSENIDKFSALSFSDIKVGDLIVHVEHGIGYFEGLQKLNVAGIEAEFITLRYKDNDKLLLPVYRVGQIQKYSGPVSDHLVAKLGSSQWSATKVKVKNKLRDVAAELLNLYALRNSIHRPSLSPPDSDYFKFEDEFPYEETEDQLKAINDILVDFSRPRPMDRLICGDVGFGKTEVALRAAFRIVQEKKLVAVMAPTTVLTLQHFENFKKRFAAWPVEIRLLNRFVSRAETAKTLKDLKEGKIDILIGTHRLLSKDVIFPNLGLLIIDEEHKFGVMHKERIRKLSQNIDTLSLSATPIPRTLNMSLVGIRDISIITTAPVDRLPIRTFICKFDESTIAKAIRSELARGGQVFFIHNRVQSIYNLYQKLVALVPEAKIAIGHGQMEAKDLEETFVSFFKKEIDVLLCTTIIESGMDIPNANTMFIDRADTFGLSQLYQLRGRIGRSSKRAYCYLLIPETSALDKQAQERLKVIQENTALGSGFKIAQHDLELRGAGNILGEDQSGHIAAVGFELYYELLEETLKSARGEPTDEFIPDPEINVRIPALIPDSYIPDIRLRLAYYKTLSYIQSQEDIDRYSEEMRDQFGPLPEPTVNLMGLMLIRSLCRQLRIKDLSSGLKNISLLFTDKTPLPSVTIIQLINLENKKFSFTKDGRLLIRMNQITLENILNELEFLLNQCP